MGRKDLYHFLTLKCDGFTFKLISRKKQTRFVPFEDITPSRV